MKMLLYSLKLHKERCAREVYEFSPRKSSVTDVKYNNMTMKKSKVLPIANSKCNSKLEADDEKILELLADNPSGGSSDTNKSILCEFCGLMFKNLASVNVHIKGVHHIKEALRNTHVDVMGFKNRQEQNQAEQITLKMEITVEETKLQHANSGISTTNPFAITDCTDFGHHSKDQKVEKSALPSVDFSRQKSDMRLNEHSYANMNGAADDTDYNMTEKEPEVLAEEKNLQPLVDQKGCSQEQETSHSGQSFEGFGRSGEDTQPLAEKPSNASSDTKCSHCKKQFVSVRSLSKHIRSYHKSTTCNICRKVYPGYTSAWFHKKTKHADLSQHVEEQEIVDSDPTAVSFSGQHSALTRVSSDTHGEIDPMKVSSKNNTGSTLQPLGETKCTHCGKEYSGLFALTRHIELVHVQQSCDVCGITLPSYFKARYHMVTKHTEAKHRCPHCTQKFHFLKRYQEHLLRCRIKKFSCLLCDQKFKSSKCFGDHMREFHKNEETSTEVLIDRIGCNEEHEQNQSEKICLNQEISEEETTLNPFVITNCPICGKNVGDQNQVSHHVEAIHQLTMCISCGMTFTSANQHNNHKLTCPQQLKQRRQYKNALAVKDHLRRTHSLIDDQTDSTIFNEQEQEFQHCEDVHLLQGENMELKLEIKVEETTLQEQEYQAPDEDRGKSPTFAVLSARQLKAHKLRTQSLMDDQTDSTDCNEQEQEQKPCEDVNLLQGENMELKMEIKVEETTLQEQEYQAPDEDRGKSPTFTIISARQLKVSKDKYRLQRHVRSAHPPCKWPCRKCDLMFSTRDKLRQHKRKAHTEPKFKCSHCLKKFNTKAELNHHELTHSNPLERNVACKLCPKTFRDEYGLHRHVYSTHPSTELPCGMCDLKFSTRPKLFHHMKTIHKPECDKPFLVKSALRKHMDVHFKATEKQQRSDDFKRRRLEAKEEKPPLDDNTGHRLKGKSKMPSLERRRSNRMRAKQ